MSDKLPRRHILYWMGMLGMLVMGYWGAGVITRYGSNINFLIFGLSLLLVLYMLNNENNWFGD